MSDYSLLAGWASIALQALVGGAAFWAACKILSDFGQKDH